MIRHPRIPALLAIILTLALGLGLLAATGQFRAANLAAASLDELEQKVGTSNDPAVWCAYGDKLREAAQRDPIYFEKAAKAYARALQLQPDSAIAQLNQGIALAQTKNPADAFFLYASRLMTNYPRVVVDLMERPELKNLHADPRWEPTAAAARAQAVD